jgi:Protein of unknown function (DUF2905)
MGWLHELLPLLQPLLLLQAIGCLKAARTSPWCHAQFGSTRFSSRFFLVGAAMSRTLIVIGLILVAVGLLWPWLSRIGLGRLPGDIVIERENFTFYAPIVTGILISIVLSIILWLVNR